MTEAEELELLELEYQEGEGANQTPPISSPVIEQDGAWQPMEQTGKMSDFATGSGTPNPEKWTARLPVDLALAYGSGGASLAAGGSKFLVQHAPGLSKLLSLAGTALTNPTNPLSAAFGGGIEGAATETARGGSISDIAKAAAIGSAAAGVGDFALRPFAGGFKTDPRAQNLIDKGVDVTTGGRIGRGGRNFEDKLTSVPGMGDAIIGAKNRERETFNRMLVDDALAPLANTPPGKDLIPFASDDIIPRMDRVPDDIPTGPDAISFADDQISTRYDDVLDKMTVTRDREFTGEIDQLKSMAESLPSKERARFNQILDESLDTSISGGSDMLLGQTYKKVFRRLRDEGLRYKKSPDAFQQDLGNALHETALALKRVGQRQNPVQSKRLAAADKAFAKMATIRKAAETQGAEDNIFTPNQYISEVRKGATGKQYSQGRAYNQGIAADARAVMAQKIPDSGTTGRAIAAGLLGGGAASTGTLVPALLGTGAGMAAYSKLGQRMVNNLMFEGAEPSIRRTVAPLTGLLSAMGANEALREEEEY